MKITQSFTVHRPRPIVWAFFQDIAEVSRCMPGAELTEDKGDGRYAGRVAIKLGPFNASFEGEAEVSADPASYTGHAEGKGTDKRGGSRSKLVLHYALTEAGPATEVSIDADVQLSGPVAQFGRTGIISETATILIGQFVNNVEARLAAPPVEPAVESNGQDPGETAPVSEPATIAAATAASPPLAAGSISVLSIVQALIASFLRRLLGGKDPAQR